MAEKKKQPAVIKKELTQQVLTKVKAFTETGELKIPKDYSPENALKGAMLILDDMKALEKYEKNSIAQSLLKMVVEGLSPLKQQGYFIPYGKELNWSRSYQGAIALAKRVGGVKDVVENVIYEGDDFEYRVDQETGYKKLVKHQQQLENIDNSKIKGAYAIVIYNDGRTDLEIMTIAEIRQAWMQGPMKGNSPAHKNFTQEMCKKTVINRACKGPINSSDDRCVIDQNNESDEIMYQSEVQQEIEQSTATEEIDFEEIQEASKQEEEQTDNEQPSETLFKEESEDKDGPNF